MATNAKSGEKKPTTKKTTAKKTTAKPKVEKVEEIEKVGGYTPTEVEVVPEPPKTDSTVTKPNAKTFTETEVQDMIAKAVAEAMARANTTPSVVQVESKAEMVTLMYIGGIASGTSVYLGDRIGRIFRDGDSIDVEKKVFMSNINPVVDMLLRNRQLMVIDGLTEEERIRYGVDYKPNELLDNKMFQRLLDYPTDDLVEIYRKLCDEHKAIVTKVLYTASLKNDKRITPNKLKAILKVDKELGITKSPLLDEMKRLEIEI